MTQKSSIIARFSRIKNGIITHRDDMPTELQTLLKIDELFATGETFIKTYEEEVAAREKIDTVRDERRSEYGELKIAFNLCKNLIQAHVGEHDKEKLTIFIKNGKYIERAIYLRNALRTDAEVLTKVGEPHLEELERAINEFQHAVAEENVIEEKLDSADEATDEISSSFLHDVLAAKYYIRAWLYSIKRLDLYAEFVKPRSVKVKSISEENK
jgi:hypothetical protein